MNFVEYVRQQINWSREAFGPGKRTKGVLDHIRKELKEIEAAPDDLDEWIDVIILATDGAWRAGYTAEQIATALFNKQTKNVNRTWPDWRTRSEDEAIEHDRSVDAPPLPYICWNCKTQQHDHGPTCASCGKDMVIVNTKHIDWAKEHHTDVQIPAKE